MTEMVQKHLVVTECFHSVCDSCYDQLVKHQANPQCPYCKADISYKTVLIHPRMNTKIESKMDKLLDEISKVPQEDKIIIYTQFHDLMLRIANLFD